MTNQDLRRILVWLNGSIDQITTIFTNSTNPLGLFVTTTGDILVANDLYHRVDRWSLSATHPIPVMSVCDTCYSLFIDIGNTLFCATPHTHQVVAKSLKSSENTMTLFGTGDCGNTSDMLCLPYGIVVSTDLDLYVADCGNDRIQLFRHKESSATTIVLSGTSGTITLDCPKAIALDADENLFIVDSGNHRIVGSDATGFRCVVGCFGGGSAANKLQSPTSMSFDSYGNLFVSDTNNSRIQKFVLSSNSCGEYNII